MITVLSGADFDSNPITLTFAAREVSRTVNISVMCDKMVEKGQGMDKTERFDISLVLTINNPQVRTGRNTTEVRIRDSTGK